ncbi:hypothetical protein BO82DRAFT_323271, partial [Aspergillus uvarum CBS 121591]
PSFILFLFSPYSSNPLSLPLPHTHTHTLSLSLSLALASPLSSFFRFPFLHLSSSHFYSLTLLSDHPLNHPLLKTTTPALYQSIVQIFIDRLDSGLSISIPP